MTILDPTLQYEIAEHRPNTSPGLLSKEEKDRLIERTFVGLYRWYVSRSQKTRNWNPNTDFDWRNFGTQHSEQLNQIIEGFFAVEQFVPDYVSQLLQVIRKSFGRSHFHIRWGAEEEKHSDLWENSLLFSRFRTPEWIEDYKNLLREKQWELPWENPLHMIFYTVIQERATQVNYLNTGLIAQGKSAHPEFAQDADPVLARVAQTIAVDEAAHYNFFLEGARVFMYYYPTQAIEALHDVIKFFAMPAGNLIPNYDRFAETVANANIYGPREHIRDVLDVALNQLGIKGRAALRKGINLVRQVPTMEGPMRETAIFDVLDYAGVKAKVENVFSRINEYETQVGFHLVSPLQFVTNDIREG